MENGVFPIKKIANRDDLTSEESLRAYLEAFSEETRVIEEKSKTSIGQIESKLEQARDLKSKIGQNIQNKNDM